MSVEKIAKTFKCPVDLVKKWIDPSVVREPRTTMWLTMRYIKNLKLTS